MIKNLIKILNFSVTLTMVVFLVILLLVYVFLDNTVNIWFSADGTVLYHISHNTFFYGYLSLFFILQLVFYSFNRLIIDRNYASGRSLYVSFWFQGMVLAVNLFLILMIIFTGLANHDREIPFAKLALPAYGGPALVIFWLLLFPLFIRKARQANTEHS